MHYVLNFIIMLTNFRAIYIITIVDDVQFSRLA